MNWIEPGGRRQNRRFIRRRPFFDPVGLRLRPAVLERPAVIPAIGTQRIQDESGRVGSTILKAFAVQGSLNGREERLGTGASRVSGYLRLEAVTLSAQATSESRRRPGAGPPWLWSDKGREEHLASLR